MKKILLLSFLLAIPSVVFSIQDGDILIDHNTFKGNLTLSGQSFTATKTIKWTALSFEFQAASTGTLSIYAGNTVTGTPIHTQPFTVAAGQQEIVLTTSIDIVQGQQYTAYTGVTCGYYPFATYAGGNSFTTTLAFPGDLWMKVTTLDTTPPVFENSTPSSTSITTTGFTLNTDINEAGKIYYVVVADGATAPTSAEVKAGTGSGGSGQVTSGNAAVSTGSFTNAFSVTGLTASTAYDVYVVAEDDEGTPNLQTSPTKIDVTTLNGSFIVVESGGSTTTNENGTTDTFTVVLNSEPNSNVVINVSSGDLTEGTVDKSALTFTTANWDTAQTVTVTGLDDGLLDGSPSYDVTLSINAALTDDAFDGAANQTVSVTNFDNEITAANAGADQNVCGASTFLGGNAPGGSPESGTWSIISGTGGSFTSASNPISAFSGTTNTAYTLRWTIDNGGVSESIDDVVITLFDNPTASAAGPDQNNISGTATLAANTISGLNATGTWTQVAGPGVVTFGDANSNISTATVPIVGNYTFRWTSSNGVCPLSTDDVDVVFNAIAPVFENSTPSSASITETGFTLNTDINQAGTIYYVVVTDGATAPTSAEVKAGTGSGGSGQVTSGNAAVSTGSFTNDFIVTSLTGGTAYDVYVVAEDDESVPNLQSSPTKIDVTTLNSPPTFTSAAVTSVKAGSVYSYEITGSDPDGDAFSFTAPTLPSWLTLETNSTVSTLAGDGTADFADGTGTAARFNQPYGVAVDRLGNVYVGDLSNHRIRKISSAGVVTTLAGSTRGFANGTGAAAQFNDPRGIAVDESGNIYVADIGNHRIRKVTPAGVVTTLAGSSQGYTDDTGTAAQFYSPTEVAVDASGNVYVADQGNHRIRKITPAGVVTTLAGSGTKGFAEGTGTAAQFNEPFGITVDGSNNVYVADRVNNRIRKITPAGVVSTLAGSGVSGFADGTGAAAQFSSPFGLDADDFGNIYVADFSNRRIRKISPVGVVTTVAGNGTSGLVNGPGISAQFNFPAGVSVDESNNVYVADYSNHIIRKIEQKVILTGTPTAADIGDHNVVLQASDDKGGTVQQSFTVSVLEAVPPVFENSTPSAASIAATSFTLNTDIDEAGTIYYVVVDDGATAPSSVEIKAGTSSGGAAVVASGNATVTTGDFTHAFSVSDLASLTAYDVYVVAEDDESTPNLQAGPTKIDVTTLNEDITLPTVTTTDAASIVQLSATLGGNVTHEEGSTVTDRGIVYSITAANANPLINGTGVTQDTNGAGTGVFNESITGLLANTQYSFKAYAISSIGTVYGVVKTFTTTVLVSPTIVLKKKYGFSPNGDGINDNWTIENIEQYPNNMVSVFNRSGKLVYKQKGYENSWNGISNKIGGNNKLPVGPYIFIIDLGDGSQPTQGWLYINY